MSKTYSAGIVTAYGAAKRAGYTGTYEDFCRQQAEYAENAAAVEQAKTTAVNAAATATTKAGEASTASTAAQTAKAQTEQAASQALTDIAAARSGAISAVQTEGQTQTANARAQAQAAAQSATTASAKASEASASATSAGLSATNAATSATSAAQSASAAQSVLESIPEEYSDLSEDVDKLKADLNNIVPSVLKTAIVSDYVTTASNYYRVLESDPSADQDYTVRITCATSGNHTFQIGTAGSAGSMKDTFGTFNMTANVPIYINGYTPSGTGYKYVKNTVGDEWDVKFCIIDDSLAEDTRQAITQIDGLETDVASINAKFTTSIGKNRFSGQNLSTGYYNTQGSIVANSNWTLADYTDVEGFDDVAFSAMVNGTRRLFALSFIAFFDSEKVFIEQINSATSAEVPETAKYMRFSWLTVPVDLQVEEGTTYTQYEPYEEYNEIVDSPYLKDVVKPYSEIRWAVFGDSMTEKNSKATFSYYDYVHEDLGCSIVNYGASGTGYKAREAEELAFYQRMLNVDPTAFDVLTIFGSVNDAGLTVGEITDSGTDTLCGCINTSIDNFYSVAPFKTIGLVTPPPTRSLNYTAQDTTWIDAYVDAIIGIAKRRSIPVMDMYHESGLRPYNEAFKVEYYNENGSQDVGVHPNSKAHKQFLYPKFRQFFKKLV